MPTILPIRSALSSYSFRCLLADVEYSFLFRWNRIESAWFFNILDSANLPIAYGLKLVCGAYIGRAYTHVLFRSGIFVARPTGKDRRDARFDDAGTRVQLWYFTNAEVVAAVIADVSGQEAQ